MVDILVSLKCGGNFSVSCEHFYVSGDFIRFSIQNYDVCSVYLPEVNYIYSFHYSYDFDECVCHKEYLFTDGKIIKVI